MSYNCAMLIPPSQLKPHTLRALVEEFVTRDGTDLADAAMKIDQVLRAIETGRAEIHFDEQTETTTIVPVDRW